MQKDGAEKKVLVRIKTEKGHPGSDGTPREDYQEWWHKKKKEIA